METTEQILRSSFHPKTHADNFINYLEVIIDSNGKVEYAVPSHTEKILSVACAKYDMRRDDIISEYEHMISRRDQMYIDFITWLMSITNCIAVWNEFYMGKPNKKQFMKLIELKSYGLYRGEIKKNHQ